MLHGNIRLIIGGVDRNPSVDSQGLNDRRTWVTSRKSPAPLAKGARRQPRGIGCDALGPKFRAAKLWGSSQARLGRTGAEPADKPGSVVDSHSSRRSVTTTLKQPTRRHRGPRHCLPIWSCSRWGLPCRSVAGLAVRSYRTVSPLPRTPFDAVRRSALCCTFRRLAPPRRYLAPCPVEPGLSSAPFRMTRLPGRLRVANSTAFAFEFPKVCCTNFGPRSGCLQFAAAAAASPLPKGAVATVGTRVSADENARRVQHLHRGSRCAAFSPSPVGRGVGVRGGTGDARKRQCPPSCPHR